MKTVITGGTGFIGSHLVKRLLTEGRDITVVGLNLKTDNLETLGIYCPNVKFIQADLRNYEQTLIAIRGANTVFHLAGHIGSLESHSGSSEFNTLQENIIIDANVFKACIETGIEKLIYASSCSVYPIVNNLDIIYSEDDRQVLPYYKISARYFDSINPDGGYGWAKLIGETELGMIKNINIGIARMFNIYGVNEPLEYGARVVGRFIKTILSNNSIIISGDGKQTRDFIYISDCVDALIKLESKVSNPPLTINIGSEQAVSIAEIAQKLVTISGSNNLIIFNSNGGYGILSRTANISKAKELLNWNPTITLEDGLKRTYEWAKQQC